MSFHHDRVVVAYDDGGPSDLVTEFKMLEFVDRCLMPTTISKHPHFSDRSGRPCHWFCFRDLFQSLRSPGRLDDDGIDPNSFFSRQKSVLLAMFLIEVSCHLFDRCDRDFDQRIGALIAQVNFSAVRDITCSNALVG